ncbi:hypothetical protein P0D69_28110 [Paraburkholderia sediminicola]|uniref:hypothetical protein n=1 Tax=Paraburkholderia sediminicola TaxID=458836 RepID=UPI0038BCC545
MTAAVATQPQMRLSWGRSLFIKLLPFYMIIGVIEMFGFFQQMDTGARIVQLVFGLPVALYLGYMWVIKPLLIAAGLTFVLALRLLPLLLTGFGMGVGFWIAMHIL